MELLDTATGPVAWYADGPVDGPPIVMLPSGAHDHCDFDEIRALLPSAFRTVTLDWPAHGASPAGSGPTSAMRFADVAEALVERVAPQGAVVVGNSVGGFAAGRLAVRRPELVRGLVLVDCGGFEPPVRQDRIFCALMSRRWFLRAIYPAFSRTYMRARTDADRRARSAAIETTRRDPGLRAVSELWRSFSAPEHDLRSEAETIEAPTLILWGRRDPVIPARVGERLAEEIPDARLVLFDTGHVPHTTDPRGVAAELIPFAERATRS